MVSNARDGGSGGERGDDDGNSINVGSGACVVASGGMMSMALMEMWW